MRTECTLQQQMLFPGQTCNKNNNIVHECLPWPPLPVSRWDASALEQQHRVCDRIKEPATLVVRQQLEQELRERGERELWFLQFHRGWGECDWFYGPVCMYEHWYVHCPGANRQRVKRGGKEGLEYQEKEKMCQLSWRARVWLKDSGKVMTSQM